MDPDRRRPHLDLELWSPRPDGTSTVAAQGSDRLDCEQPFEFALDLTRHAEFADAVIAAAAAGEL